MLYLWHFLLKIECLHVAFIHVLTCSDCRGHVSELQLAILLIVMCLFCNLWVYCLFYTFLLTIAWLPEIFLTSLKPLHGIQQTLTGRNISMSSTMFVFFWLIGKSKWLPWPLICWDIIYISPETIQWKSTKT